MWNKLPGWTKENGIRWGQGPLFPVSGLRYCLIDTNLSFTAGLANSNLEPNLHGFVCLFFHLWAGIMSVWVLWAGHTGDTVEQGATLPGSRALTEQTAFNSVGARCFLGDISLWIAILDSSKEIFSVSSEVTCLWQVLLAILLSCPSNVPRPPPEEWGMDEDLESSAVWGTPF